MPRLRKTSRYLLHNPCSFMMENDDSRLMHSNYSPVHSSTSPNLAHSEQLRSALHRYDCLGPLCVLRPPCVASCVRLAARAGPILHRPDMDNTMRPATLTQSQRPRTWAACRINTGRRVRANARRTMALMGKTLELQRRNATSCSGNGSGMVISATLRNRELKN